MLSELGQFEAAASACRRAIQLKPNYAEAHNNLGNALRDQGHLSEAIAACRRAIQFEPNCAGAHSNRRAGRVPGLGDQRGHGGGLSAGAMSKPVWLLNRFDTCSRWLLGRSDSR